MKDRIVAVEGVETLDPMHLPDVFAQRAGKPVVVQVVRSEGGKPEETLRLTVTPQPDTPWLEWVADRPLGIPGLGLAFEVQPTITAVRSDTPPPAQGLKPGDVLASLALTRATRTTPKSNPRPSPFPPRSNRSRLPFTGSSSCRPRRSSSSWPIAGRPSP